MKLTAKPQNIKNTSNNPDAHLTHPEGHLFLRHLSIPALLHAGVPAPVGGEGGLLAALSKQVAVGQCVDLRS